MLCTLHDAPSAAATVAPARLGLVIPLMSLPWFMVEGGLLFPFFTGDISVLERVPTFVLSQKTEGNGVPKSCFLCQSLGLFHVGIGSKLD